MGVIACCLLDRSVLVECIDMGLTGDSFFKEAHKAIFSALMDIAMEDDGDIHEVKLLDKLIERGQEDDCGGIAYIYQIQNAVDTPTHAKYFLKRVLSTYNQRRLIRSCRKTIEACCDKSADVPELTSRLELDVKRINDSCSAKSEIVSIGEVVEELKQDIDERINNPEKAAARAITPLVDLNNILPRGGFLPGQLVVIAARPSVGKTSLAINIAEKTAVDNQAPVLIFSLEMSPMELASRAACSRSRVDSKQLEDGFLRPQSRQKFNQCLSEIQNSKISFYKYESINILKICANARSKANQIARKGDSLGLIIIDYLQLIEGVDKKLRREEQIAEMTRSLKLLARELEVPIIALSQLNRSGEKDGRKPRLSDLRESGSIEQNADIVLLMHRPDQFEYSDGAYPDPNVEVIQVLHAKVRNGPVGMIESTFMRNYTRFENYQK